MVFLNFINKELIRIKDILAKNENKNVLFERKHTKFWINKYNTVIINPPNKEGNNTMTLRET